MIRPDPTGEFRWIYETPDGAVGRTNRSRREIRRIIAKQNRRRVELYGHVDLVAEPLQGKTFGRPLQCANGHDLIKHGELTWQGRRVCWVCRQERNARRRKN